MRAHLSQSRAPLVSVVIPTWNGKELLNDVVLPSLKRQAFEEFEVIVVDNGSSDGSVELLAREWPGVIVLKLKFNTGFAAAVNRGIAHSRAEYVALVNNDIELAPRWLEELVHAMEEHFDAASVTGKLLDFHQRDVIAAVGDTMAWNSLYGGRGRGERDTGQYQHAVPVFSGCGGATLYRRAALEAVGDFDEDFFAYCEDLDWGFRAQLSGYSCWYVPGAVGYHVGKSTSARVAGFMRAMLLRNSFWLVVKDFPARHVVSNCHKIAFVQAQRSAELARATSLRQVGRSWWEAAAKLPVMVRRRRKIQANRRASDIQLAAVVGSEALRSAKLDSIRQRLRWVSRPF